MVENIVATYRVKGIFKGDPQKVYEEIREICEDIGEAKPRQIVDKAEDESTELHKCFNWDNDDAADKWRLHQAVMLTSNLVFKREVKKYRSGRSRFSQNMKHCSREHMQNSMRSKSSMRLLKSWITYLS